jgi:hypothetical protein
MSKELDISTGTDTMNSDNVVEEGYVLPRPAWNDQVAYFRVLFKAKKALDRVEQEHLTHHK